MPRHQPPLPIVTASGGTVTQAQFGHGPARHRPPADKPGQAGKTVTVKAVCRSDIQAQRGGAGTVFLFFLISNFWSVSSCRHCTRDIYEDMERVNAWSAVENILQTVPVPGDRENTFR